MSDISVLIVEDEENILKSLKYNLEKNGYRVITASDGEQCIELNRELSPDIIILDIMLPKLDGLEACRIIRQESDVPIIMLTAKVEEIDRVVGLELGADDYVTKPFYMREIIARVRSLLKRNKRIQLNTYQNNLDNIRVNNLTLDLLGHSVKIGGEDLALKPREFALLSLFMKNKGQAFTREQLLQQAWGYDYLGDTRTVDVHVRWLREKIELNPSQPTRIVTVRRVGYRFEK